MSRIQTLICCCLQLECLRSQVRLSCSTLPGGQPKQNPQQSLEASAAAVETTCGASCLITQTNLPATRQVLAWLLLLLLLPQLPELHCLQQHR